MINSRLLKNRFTSTITTLIIILLISACNSEANLSTATADSVPDTNTGISTDTTANHAAVISGIDSGSVTEDVITYGNGLLEVGGALKITDSDAGEAAFIANAHNSNHGNYGQLVINTEGNWWYYADNKQTAIQNLALGATLTDSLIVSSIDGTTHTVVIIIKGTNENGAVADINLSWIAPAEREDNSAISLSEIAGYKVSFGMTQGQYSSSIIINDGTAVGHTFTDFPAGTYYFVVSTLDTEGRESQYSTEVKVII